jgi:hypothetical protein
MDNNMVFSYDYGKQKKRQQKTNAPPSLAILMAMAVRQSNSDGIAQCVMSRATREATGHRHRVTTCYILPQRPPGQQKMK